MRDSASGNGNGAAPQGRRYLLGLCLAAVGVVYGDIGTSPLYALRECFHGEHAVAVTHDNVIGVVSLIFWSLTLVISIKYLMYVMRADNKGEGGILALMALAQSGERGSRYVRRAVLLLGLFGAALLYGDGMITPAISVLSAVEGLHVAAPSMAGYVEPLTIAILVGLFWIQSRGTARVGAIFGPIMVLWFATLTVLGAAYVIQRPEVLLGLSPGYGAGFLIRHKLHGLLVLGAVFLVVTGGEALYADMGHFGIRPIRLTWFCLVLPALVINYFGQGALLLDHPGARVSPFYRMVPHWALYPMVALATLATVIASQAVISGAYSLTRQAMMLGFLPRMRVQHTSAREMGQIYAPATNWVLMLATIGLVLGFRSSSNLAAAYGVAVTTTMVITTALAWIVARQLWGWSGWLAAAVTVLFLVFDLAFFSSNLVKVEQGGWFPLLVALGVFLLMTTWQRGRRLLGQRIRAAIVPLADLYELIRVERPARVPGTAVFMTSNPEGTPPALMHNFRHNRVLHEQNVLLTIVTEDVARVSEDERLTVQQLEEGFLRVVARYGFMEQPDIPALLSSGAVPGCTPAQTTFFLGRETLLAAGAGGMSRWRESLFAVMSKNAQRATAFYNIPPDQVMEIGAQIEL